MRLLIVTHLFAPALSPRAFRWHAIARHWAAQGHDVEVVTAPHPGSPPTETLDGIRVLRIGSRFEAWRARFAPPAITAAVPAAAPPRASRRAAKWLHDRTWKRIYWPDHATTWYGAAGPRAHARGGPARHDAVITVALPFTAHLVGLACRDQAPAWLADSGDPFSLNLASPPNNRWLYDGLNRRAEARVLAAADSLTVTTAGTRERILAAFPAARGKVAVIPPVAAPPAAPDDGNRFFPVDGKRRLVFLGNLYPGLREPGPLLDLLRRLRAAEPQLLAAHEVHLFGAPGNFADALAAAAAEWPGLRWHAPVDRPTVARVLATADALINIGNATEDQLPSKLVEYASTGKPILNLATRADDGSASFLVGYPLACTIVAQNGSLPLDPLRAFLHGMLGRRLDAAAIARFLAPYSLERVADAYLALLDVPARPELAA
jgi:hypothetical protein